MISLRDCSDNFPIVSPKAFHANPCHWIAVGLLLCSGCLAPQGGITLDPVGPGLDETTQSATGGGLIVYSAFEGSPTTSVSLNRRHHTDYRIINSDQSLLRRVHNDTDTILEEPIQVNLTPGLYSVVARANGYGIVTVPVVIAAKRITVVNLDGSSAVSTRQVVEVTAMVQLPGGEIVGRRAPVGITPLP